MRLAVIGSYLVLVALVPGQFSCPVSISPPVWVTSMLPGTTTQWGFGAVGSTLLPNYGYWSISFFSPDVSASITSYGTFGLANIALSPTASGTYLGTVGFSGFCCGSPFWCSGGASASIYLTAGTAGFYASPTTGTAPLTVTFSTPATVPGPTYFWFFGDGDSNFTLSPSSSHVYTTPGMHQTSMWITSYGSTAAVVQGPVINVLPPALAVTGASPPVAGVTGGDIVEISGAGFLPGAPTVLIGGQAATAVSVLSLSALQCTVPASITGSGPCAIDIQYAWGSVSGIGTLEYVPVVTQVIPGSISAPTPTLLDITCAGLGPGSTLLVNGTVVPHVPTPTGMQATIQPQLWQPTGAAVIQVTSAGTVGSVSRAFAVPATTATNQGVCSGSPIGASSGTIGWVGVSGLPSGVAVTLVADSMPPPTLFGWPAQGQFVLGVGGPGLFTVFDGMGVFGVAQPFATDATGTVGRLVTAPAIPPGTTIRLQAVWSDAASPLGLGLTWITTLSF